MTATLSVGTHTIAATVTDSGGLTDADTITVNVTAAAVFRLGHTGGEVCEIRAQYRQVANQPKGTGQSDHGA